MEHIILIQELAEKAKEKAETEDIRLEEAVGFVLKTHPQLFYKVLDAARGKKRKLYSAKSPFYEDAAPTVTEGGSSPLDRRASPSPGELL